MVTDDGTGAGINKTDYKRLPEDSLYQHVRDICLEQRGTSGFSATAARLVARYLSKTDYNPFDPDDRKVVYSLYDVVKVLIEQDYIVPGRRYWDMYAGL